MLTYYDIWYVFETLIQREGLQLCVLFYYRRFRVKYANRPNIYRNIYFICDIIYT